MNNTRQALLEYCIECTSNAYDSTETSMYFPGVTSLCLSSDSSARARHSIHADKKKHGDCHYTVDSPLPHIVFNGLIVRTENLFRVGEQGFAEVTWGVKVKLEKRTGCFEYSFPGPTTILAAGRLISYDFTRQL